MKVLNISEFKRYSKLSVIRKCSNCLRFIFHNIAACILI